MLNEEIVQAMYENNAIAESFDNYKKRITRGLILVTNKEQTGVASLHTLSDVEDINLALKYNLEVMMSLLK